MSYNARAGRHNDREPSTKTVISGTKLVGIILAIALSSCAPQREYVDRNEIGSIVTPGNTQVPLPPGHWQKLVEQTVAGGRETSGGTNNLRYVETYYGRVENGRLASVIYVHTSADAQALGGYLPNSFCRETNRPEWTYLQEVRGETLNNSDCMKVDRHEALSPPHSSSRRFYADFFQAAQKLGGIPQSGVRVIFAEAFGFHLLEYAIYYFPDRDGVTGNNWRFGAEGPNEKAYVFKIVNWAQQFHSAVRNGTQNLL